MNKDIFIITSEAELTRFSRLMNKASREYWHLKDRTTEYAKSVYGCYYLNKMNYEKTLETIKQYKNGEIKYENT